MRCKSMFCCPVCGDKFRIEDKMYKCGKGHSFDTAKSGYVNLLTVDRMNTKSPGDNKLMVRSRTEFLDKGYYSHIRKAVCRVLMGYAKDGMSVLDLGCGEGYYTSGFCDALVSAGKHVCVGGLDISKFAVDRAAKRNKYCEFAVGTIFHIPAPDGSADIVLNGFAPFCREEFLRVLKDGGIMIQVIPDKGHLLELKKAVYDEPYENEPKPAGIEGFEFLNSVSVQKRIFLDNNEDIMSLFKMTPYYYKTSLEDTQKLEKLQSLETDTEILILIYKKLVSENDDSE